MSKIIIDPEFAYGELVSLKSDPEMLGIIIGYVVTQGSLHYLVKCGIDDAQQFSSFELADEKGYMKD